MYDLCISWVKNKKNSELKNVFVPPSINSRSNMDLLLIKYLQLTLVIINCQSLLAPAVILTKAERTSYNGSSIAITCEYSAPKNSNLANTVYPAASPDIVTPFPNKIHHCADDPDGLFTTNIHDQQNSMWLYVYVQSDTSTSATSYQIEGLPADFKDTVIIPCRLASLNRSIPTFDDKKIKDLSDGSKRKTGFIIKHVAMKNGGFFPCRINSDDGVSEMVTFIVRVSIKPETINKPRIIQDQSSHVIEGEDLRLSCKADVHTRWDYTIQWTTPQSSNRITINVVDPLYRNKEGTAIRELIIKNVTKEDGGEYECTVSASDKSNSSKTYVTIHDRNDKFINLTGSTNQTDYLQKLGSSLVWVVDYDGNPRPKIKWLDPKNETIINDAKKYIISKTSTKSSLKILDLQMADIGIYTVETKTENEKDPQSKKVMYNLTVWSKPQVTMVVEKNRDYYNPDKEVQFVCVIKAYPRPNVTWSFQKYSSGPSKHNLDSEQLKEYIIDDCCPQFTSTLTMKVKTSGTLSCEAHNKHGSDSFKHSIFVSDAPHGFGIIEPPRNIAVGDNVELICGASIYNYTNSIEWILDEESRKLLTENKKLIITNTQTPFSYQSILHINNIDKSDEKKLYTCKVSHNEGNSRQDQKRLVVNEAREPYVIEVNMNGTERIYNSETARTTIITLKCYIGGMPPPVISWWKDDQILNATEDLYIFTNDNSELEIKHPRTSESGEYSCIAKNRLNTLKIYQKIKILGEEVSKILIISMVVLSIICVILVVYFSIKIHREKVTKKKMMEVGLTHFENGALECLNPELTVDDQAELLPYDKKWEFPRERLRFDKQLGCGAFGVVMKAEATRICKNESSTTVAVKMVRHSAESTYIRALSSELKIMIHLGKHLNVVNLLGACTRNIVKRELLVIVEYCQFGNLHNYLLRHRSDFINQIDPATAKIDPSIGRQSRPVSVDSDKSISLSSRSGFDLISYTSDSDSQGVNVSSSGITFSNNSAQPGWRSNYRGDYTDQNLNPICTQDLLSWAFQVARGMEYLSQRKVLHGDLAARNILLADNNVVKICDFGLAKTMYKSENYEKKGEALLPIKWMAIESIRDRVFSTQSDIWAFGIVLWEFFTLAETPYPGMGAEKQYQKLIEGYRMEKPEFSTADMYDIMLECWKEKPSVRPTFTDLVQNIGNLLDESVKTHYLDLNAPYMDINTMIFKNGKNDYLTLMSAPDHETLSSRTEREYVNLLDIPARPGFDRPNECATPANIKDSESGVELAPMLKNEDDNYLKPINVQERRAEFVKQGLAMKNAVTETKSIERDSSYCNIPQNTRLLGIHDDEVNDKTNTLKTHIDKKYDKKEFNNYMSDVIKTEDNYINMPNHKNDLRRDAPDSFTNPIYVFMATDNTLTLDYEELYI